MDYFKPEASQTQRKPNSMLFREDYSSTNARLEATKLFSHPLLLVKIRAARDCTKQTIFYTFCTGHQYSNLAAHPNSKIYDSHSVEDT